MSFNLDDYVDVAERIRIFRDKFPEGSLQSEISFSRDGEHGPIVGVLCKAWAFRSQEDQRPGLGHSYLRVPGTTPYTKDSEVENAETSAWGRAIVAALAADTKKIASRQEVKKVSAAGSDAGEARGASAATGDTSGVTKSGSEAQPVADATTDGWTWPFGKNKGKTLADTPREYLDWFLSNGKDAEILERVNAFLLGGELEAAGAIHSSFYGDAAGTDDDIPFAPTIAEGF